MEPTLEFPIQKGIITLGGSVSQFDPLVTLTLLLLAGLSLLCWTIIGTKVFLLWKMRFSNQEFRSIVQEGAAGISFKQIQSLLRDYPNHPFSRIASNLLQVSRRYRPTEKSFEVWYQHLSHIARSCAQTDLQALEKGVPLLATVASSAPFIGLFGTVWGVIDAFRNIGAMTSFASFQSVAPGMAAALIATAAGLAVAIPALIAHNLLIGHLQGLEQSLEQSSTHLLMDLYNQPGHASYEDSAHSSR